MAKAYLFARRTGTQGTLLVEIDKKEAVQLMRANRKIGYQLGIVGGGSVSSIKKVYGEYAPFKLLDSVEEMFDAMKS